MAIGSEPVAELVTGHTKWIDLPSGELFDARAIGSKSKRIARYQMDLRTIGGFHMRLVIEAMAGINPTIGAPANGIDHAVRIASCIEWSE